MKNHKPVRILLLSVVLVAPGVAAAQHKGPQGSESWDEYRERLNRESTEAAAALLAGSGRLQERADQANREINRVNTDRDRIASQTEFLNNVISIRKRDELDQQADELRRKWNAEYGPRIGIVNPYDGTSYYRYYDDKGFLVVTKVKGDYELLQEQRRAWQKAYSRAKAMVDAAEREYADVASQYGVVTASQAEAAWAKEEARRRLNQFTGGDEPLPTRPVAPVPDQDPGIRYRNGYPISPDHLKIPGYRGPRWVNGRLVSP